MNMRPLFINDQARAQAARIVAHAASNFYILGMQQPTPGNDPKFVGQFNHYRTVFTYTVARGAKYRHLSVSVPGKKYPNPFAVWLLAETFGFTGWDGVSADVPKDWQAHLNKQEHCVVVIQKVVE